MIIGRGKLKSTVKETCPIATLPTTNPMKTIMETWAFKVLSWLLTT